MSLSKWLSRDNGPHNRSHLSPLLQHEGEEDDREDSTMTITSTNGLRRASLVGVRFLHTLWECLLACFPIWAHQQRRIPFYEHMIGLGTS